MARNLTSSEPTDRYSNVAHLFRQKALMSFTAAPATDEEITAVEQQLGHTLPDSYKRFQKEFGNFDGAFPDVYHACTPAEGMQNIVGINFSERSDYFPKMPAHLIAFSDNSGGDSYCFDTTQFKSGECPVVFWDHEDNEEQTPEVIATDFIAWLEEELNETL